MFIRIKTDDERVMMVRADEIILLSEIKQTTPTIFTGTFIGLRNGQSITSKENYEKMAERVGQIVK